MKKIVIDAGHGGEDPGASGNGIIEKDYTLKISKYIFDRLKDMGVDVKMTRTIDETLTPTERVNRVKNAFGDSNNVVLVSNHINAGGGDGAEVIYALRNTNKLSNLVLDELAKEGQNTRKAYQRRLPSNTAKDYYFMQRDTGNIESITVEYGFLDSTGDDVNQLKNNWKNYAEATVKAITSYIGAPYIPVSDDYYVVQKGDSLWSISKKYNITVDELKNLNNLTSNTLSIGQTLKVSGLKEQEEKNTYTVKKGDSLWSISQKYNTTVDELKFLNKLTSNVLSTGQILILPEQNIIDDESYIVQKGDSLWSISKKYNITVDELKSLNNLTSNTLSIGKVLKVPSENNTYIVKKGDSLWSISQKYNTTVDKLKSLNNLTNNTLSIGQILKIK